MGGNALKTVNTERKEKEEFLIIEGNVIATLKSFFPKAQIKSLTYYREKQNFGDLDIILSENEYVEFVNNFWDNFCNKNKEARKDEFFTIKSQLASKSLVHSLFNSQECYHSYPQFSFDYTLSKDKASFQIDIVVTPNLNFDFTDNYLSYNDLGNFIGVIAGNMGLKFGNAGLNYQLIKDGKFLDVVNITMDYYKALDFLGFDSERYKKGFNNLEEIFSFVESGKYFDPVLYSLESRNAKQRARDKKRKNYALFLERNKIRKDDSQSITPFYRNKEYWFQEAINYFPDFSKKLQKILDEEDKHKQFKNMFNGKIVSKITGIPELTTELGKFIESVRADFSSPQKFQDFILSKNKEEIEKWISEEYASKFKGYANSKYSF